MSSLLAVKGETNYLLLIIFVVLLLYTTIPPPPPPQARVLLSGGQSVLPTGGRNTRWPQGEILALESPLAIISRDIRISRSNEQTLAPDSPIAQAASRANILGTAY